MEIYSVHLDDKDTSKIQNFECIVAKDKRDAILIAGNEWCIRCDSDRAKKDIYVLEHTVDKYWDSLTLKERGFKDEEIESIDWENLSDDVKMALSYEGLVVHKEEGKICYYADMELGGVK